MIEKTDMFINSTNGRNRLHVIQWKPEGRPRAILQIAHGMSEYIDRYDRFASFLAENGLLVIGNDHLGHGESVNDEGELGYFDSEEPAKTLIDDLFRVTTTIRAQYPDLPFLFMGHSMGSFMARRYMMDHGGGVCGAIFMGTGSIPAGVLKMAQTMAGGIGRFRGEKFRSKTLQKAAFGSYTKRIEKALTPFDWLSRNTVNVEKYMADPLCGFNFTVNGYRTLFSLIEYIQEPANIAKLPKNVPILLISGKEDPVGKYGENVREIREIYRKAGVREVMMKLYPDDRHEILNEEDHEQADMDILEFVEHCLKAV